jgi:hypothetical protein
VARIAGHDFVNGVCERLLANGGRCGRRWVDIRSCASDPSSIYKPDVAHYGNLTAEEWEQIRQKVQHEDYVFATATNEAVGVAPRPGPDDVLLCRPL